MYTIELFRRASFQLQNTICPLCHYLCKHIFVSNKQEPEYLAYMVTMRTIFSFLLGCLTKQTFGGMAIEVEPSY